MNYTEHQPISNSSMSITIPKKHTYLLTNGHNSQPPSAWFEIRLFYVRISPCVINNVPEFLKIAHLRREIGVSMEINGSKIPASDTATLTLRRDRIDKEASEVTYVSTDSIRVTGAIEFEVYENNSDMILCGSLERIDSSWSNGVVVGENELGLEKDLKTGWSMDCYIASGVTTGGSSFFRPKLGVSSPSIEVYVAGCCSGVPLILTKTIQLSPRRKAIRHGGLDAIPEDEETGKGYCGGSNGLIRQRKFEVSDSEVEEYERKVTPGYYSEDMYYTDEDGQLTWFNAGVRVGVGIGLGMCLGIGIGVGLLMRSYQATTRTFRRRFF